MTDETKNLKLFKYNTRTDRKEKFSVDDALNDNWDKVDEAVNANKESIAEVKGEVAGIISPPPIEFESGKFLSNDGNKLVWKEVEAGASGEELALKEDKANKGVPGGYAGLNARGKVFGSQLDLSSKQDVLVPGEGIKIVGNTISSTVTGGASGEELALKEDKANKGVANGYAGLDAEGKVPAAQLPSIELNNPYSLFDSKYSDHELNNLSWLKSEGQWNAKAVYPDAYDKLLKVQNGTETVEGLSVKLSTETYTDYDFVLNTAEETFRLPLLNGSEDLPSDRYNNLELLESGSTYTAPANGLIYVNKISGTTGQYMALGVTTGGDTIWKYATQTVSQGTQYVELIIPVKRNDAFTVNYNLTGNTNAFRFIYAQGNGSLYYYVGETVQNANLIDAGRIGEQVANKADISTPSIQAPYIKNTYVNGTSGYRIWSDGYCEQWGVIGGTSQNNLRVEFLKQYKEIPNIMTTACNTYAYEDMAINNYWHVDLHSATINRASNTGFYFNASLRSTGEKPYVGSTYWKACGYLTEGEY